MYVVEKRDLRTLPMSACKWGRRMQSRPQCASIGSVYAIFILWYRYYSQIFFQMLEQNFQVNSTWKQLAVSECGFIVEILDLSKKFLIMSLQFLFKFPSYLDRMFSSLVLYFICSVITICNLPKKISDNFFYI